MMKMAVLVGLIISGTSFAADTKPIKNSAGITKEQHMAAEAACKASNPNLQGKELKDCIKLKLGL